jgi:hypothetical protein
MTVARIMILALTMAWLIPLTLSCNSKGAEEVFVPFEFQKIGVAPGNMRLFFHSLTGSEIGGSTLAASGKAALIELEAPDNRELCGFSFAFDEKVIKRHRAIELSQARELLRELRLTEAYGENKYDHSNVEVYRKEWANPIAIELSDGSRFLRVYFDRTFSHCYYVSCTGEVGHEWLLEPRITKILKALSNSFVEGGLNPRADRAPVEPEKNTKSRANQ